MALIILTIIYFFTIFSCVFFSIKQKCDGINNDYLFIYFSIIFIIDISVLIVRQVFNSDLSIIYILADIVNVVFTYIYFRNQIGKTTYVFVLTFLSVISIAYFLDWNDWIYNDYCSIISCFYTITISLLGMYKIIQTEYSSKHKIQDIPFFWYAIASLLWSTTFLIRTIPRFYFQNVDVNFMETLRLFFAIVNIVTYVLFFILLLKYHKNEQPSLYR